MIGNSFEESVFLNTVYIENIDDRETGTGFLLSKKFENGSMGFYLFSNKHVFWGQKDKNTPKCRKKLQITFHNRKDDNSVDIESVHKFLLLVDREDRGYYEHSNPDVDVACVNISSAFDAKPLYVSSIDPAAFFDYDLRSVYSGQEVRFVGYPAGYFDHHYFLPVMRSGTIASIPGVNFNGKPQILIDAQVFPGSSGSPVFVVTPNGYRFLGILSEAAVKIADMKEVQVTEHQEKMAKKFVPLEWMGLGVLFKKDTVKEVYDQAVNGTTPKNLASK